MPCRHAFVPMVAFVALRHDVAVSTGSLEVICLLLCFKIKYPENVFLLRGNHEAGPINRAPWMDSLRCMCSVGGFVYRMHLHARFVYADE